MKATVYVQLLVLIALAATASTVFLAVTNPDLWQMLQTALHTQPGSVNSALSINDIAQSYYGDLSRSLWPEKSLFLPFGLQMLISLGLMAAMIFVGLIIPQARGLVMLLTFASVIRHMVWRAVDTLNFNTPLLGFLSILIYGSECLAFISLFLGYFQIIQPKQPLETASLDPNQPLPQVDVLVTTYNEPISVVYRTLVGCNALDYPKKRVYLLDDGNRPEMAEMAQHLGVVYLSRTQNTHAKAGNLNNALRQISGELVLVFDADHVPTRGFLNQTVGFFQKQGDLAYVQTPQHFFTLDPFQRNLVADSVVNNEQDFFFHVIQPGNDSWGAAFFAGSGAIFRRAALDSVGGFAVETVTEDVHTGLRMHAKGWKSKLYAKNLAAGLAQDSYADFIKQRLRWARGMTQILFNDHPLFTPGLSWPQRLCYLSGIWYFYNGLHRMVFLVAPLFFLLFGLMTMDAGFIELLTYYVPSFLCLFWGYSLLTYGYRHMFWAEIYETALCLYMSLAALGTLFSPKRSKFMVTPKGTVSDRLFFNWRVVVPQLALATLTVVGLCMAVYRASTSPNYLGGILTNVFWCCYNLVLLVGAVYVGQERPQYRLTPRVDKRIRCELRLLDGTMAVGYTTNISETGVATMFDEPVPIAGTMALKIMDWDINETSVFNVQAIRSTVDGNNHHYIGLRVVNRTDEQHQKLVRHMFGNEDIWAPYKQDKSILRAFALLAVSAFRIPGIEEFAFRRRTPRFQAQLSCQVQTEFGTQHNSVTHEISETGLSLSIPYDTRLRQEQPMMVRLQWNGGQVSELSTMVRRMEPQAGGQVLLGLNFVQLAKEQRLELINQIYGARDTLVRVAPTVSRMVPCTVTATGTGASIEATTQEMSEMGLRLYFSQGATGFNQEEPVRVTLQWEDGQQSQLEGVLVTPDGSGAGSNGLVYFKNVSLPQLDDLSKRMLKPQSHLAVTGPVY